jgi:hypothetical protein
MRNLPNVIKKDILMKTEFNDIWIEFNLNEVLFTNRSKLFEIPYNIETIGMILFRVENQLTIFRYSDPTFELILSNDRNMVDIEAEIKYKADISNNAGLYGFDNRKILKGEMVFEY